MDAAGVDRAIIVPPSWEGDRNDLAPEAARLHPDRFAVMGRLAIEQPESRSLVDTWKCQPGMLGVRLTFHRDFLSNIDTTWIMGCGIAEWLGWPLARRYTAEVKGVSWKPNVPFHSRLHRSRSRIGMA